MVLFKDKSIFGLALNAIERQINFFTRVIGTTLILFGVISAIAQVAKLFLEPEAIFTTVLALIFSIFIAILGTKKVLTNLVKTALKYRQTTKVIIFASPLFLCSIFVLLRIVLGYENWRKMNTEGGFIEYGTSLAFLLAAIFAFAIAKSFLAVREKFLAYVYYLISAGFFFVGMEEISWGQKLLNFKSSEFFETYNSQDEITLHNLVWVNDYMDKGLMLAALIAGISWFIYKLISKFSKLGYNYRFKYIIPSWFLASFFLIVFLFFYLIEYVQIWNSNIATFQEAIELVFSLGCFCFILTSFFSSKKSKPANFDI